MQMADAISVIRRQLDMSLAAACRVIRLMSGAELDLVETSQSPVEVAALLYQAQMRAAKRISDPAARRSAIAAARQDAEQHQRIIRERTVVSGPESSSGGVEDVPPILAHVYPTPPGVDG